MSFDTEHKFQDVFLTYLRNTTKCYAHCNTASTLSAGQPDITICNDNGFVWYVENKVWRNKSLPTAPSQVQDLLKGPQVNVIKHQLWRRNAPCIVVAQIGLVPDNVAICYKDKLFFMRWKDMIAAFSVIKSLEEFHQRIDAATHKSAS
jgi:hypothetical protein